MTDVARLTTPERRPEDLDAALRPKTLDEFIGQQAARENLRVFIHAAKSRGEPLDHVLFFGPPGLGKTTLAQIIARELGVGFRATSGPVIAKSGDLAAILTNLEDGDVLFIDEIHRLNPAVEEILYPAMEDRMLDLMIGEGPSARSVRIDLPKFTLVGATTRQGLITTPLRDRFGIPVRLIFYTVEELEQVVRRAARLLGLTLTDDGAREVARRSRGTPRIAGRLLRRVRDFAHSAGERRGRRPGRRRRPDPDGGRPSRPRRDGPALSADDRRPLQRRAGRRRDAGRGPQRAARHDRGSDRALHDPVGPDRPHRARPLPQRPGLDPSRPADARKRAGRAADLVRGKMRGRTMRKLLAAAALASASVAVAQAPAPAPALPAVDYSNGSNWLCLPGRADPCGRPLPTAALNANGYGSVGQVAPAANPRIDCFYVYPTVSRDPADNSDLVPGVEEQVAAAAQFARFATLCRPFAPIYRQTTLTALARALASGDRRPPASFEIAYGDVRAAWRRYLQHDNRGRPFVLIGHSQGAFHLQRLLASEIEGRPEARRMLSALIIGANVEVPEGRVVGGTFRARRSAPASARPAASSPTCRSAPPRRRPRPPCSAVPPRPDARSPAPIPRASAAAAASRSTAIGMPGPASPTPRRRSPGPRKARRRRPS